MITTPTKNQQLLEGVAWVAGASLLIMLGVAVIKMG